MEKYDRFSGAPSSGSMSIFTVLVVIAQVFGLAAVIIVAVWMGQYNHGFAWQEDPAREFNYHPLFMIIGMVFLYGDAILVYRVFRNERKIYIKVLHAVLHVLALLFASVGLKAVFDSHNLAKPNPMPNLYSIHSWLGLATVILFGLQWLFGFLAFLLPGFNSEMRGRYKSVHVFFGLAIFIMAIASALMGITEKMIFKGVYPKLQGEGYLANMLGLVLVVLGILVSYIVTNPSFTRQPLPEEEPIQLARDGNIQE